MHFSTRIITATFLILTSSLLNSPIQANGFWTRVSLRIEGLERTIYHGTVLTAGGIVTTQAGGTHMCDGTNHGAHTTPGGTVISAIDDAPLEHGWNGRWYKGFRDYQITSIDNEDGSQRKYWGLLVNYKLAHKGGCQTKVAADDQVPVARGAFDAVAFLEARPNKYTVEPEATITFTVVNGADGKPVASASIVSGVGSGASGPNGEVKVTVGGSATLTLRATGNSMIRSPPVTITVKAAGAGSTTTPTPMVYRDGFRCCNE